MQAVSRMVLASLVLLASACSTIRVKTNSAPDVDFAQYRTFAVEQGEVMGPNHAREPANGPAEARIRKGIADQLRAKGMVENESAPDVVATFVLGTQERTELDAFTPPYVGWGYGPWGPMGWWGGTGYPQWYTRTYVQGTLVVDLVDAHTDRAVWRAYARTDLSGSNLDPEIDRAVAKAFKDYPPA